MFDTFHLVTQIRPLLRTKIVQLYNHLLAKPKYDRVKTTVAVDFAAYRNLVSPTSRSNSMEIGDFGADDAAGPAGMTRYLELHCHWF